MVIEITSFKLVAGTNTDTFLQEHKEFHEKWIAKQPGFVKRVTAYGDDGIWKDVLTWESLEAATTAMKIVGGIEEGQTWMSMMDQLSVDMYHGNIQFEA
jgi:hypothetical protein